MKRYLDPARMAAMEQRIGCRFCEDGSFAEMGIALANYQEKTQPIEGVTYGFYQGPLAELQAAVAAVDPDWVQYFQGNSPVLCGYINGQAVSFCCVEALEDCVLHASGVRVGSIGCVGTVPEHRGRGIGLRMVDLAATELRRQGYDLAHIGYTHIDHWYARLGFETAARFSFVED